MTQSPPRWTSIGDESILKPLPPETLVDLRRGREEPWDPTGDLALNAEMRWEGMADAGYLTPTDRFFVRNHAPTPRVDPATWRLRVEGPGVERTLELGYDDLTRLPIVSVIRALECAGNGRIFFEEGQDRKPPGTSRRLGAIGVARWSGVPLGEILARAGLRETAREVMIQGLDDVGMRRPLPLWKALEGDTIVAVGMNGRILPPDHGFPARVVVPGWAAVASVNWVGHLFVSDKPLCSPWNTARYVMTGGGWGSRREPVGEQVPKSALGLPWPATLRRGRQTVTPVARGPGARHRKGRVRCGWRHAVASGSALRAQSSRGVGALALRLGGAAWNARVEGQGDGQCGQHPAGGSAVERARIPVRGVVGHPVEVL